jgi:hypothetical protein
VAAIAAALRDRGTADQAAVVAAWSAVVVFYLALDRWAEAADPRPLAQLIDEIIEEFLRTAAFSCADDIGNGEIKARSQGGSRGSTPGPTRRR